jgi:beta-glucanase (GH16 family)
MALPVSGLTLTYAEEFNSISYAGNSKMTTGSNTWNTTLSGGVRSLNGNGEKQYYMDPGYLGLGVNPFSVSNGVLNIKAAPSSAAVKSKIYGYNYTSGVLTTQNQFSQQYGYFEVRAKIPGGGQGLWPAFWMLPAKGGWPPELDILEAIGSAPFYLHQGIHSSNGSKGLGANTPNNNANDFHTYGMDWTKDKVTFYYDGVKRAEFAATVDLSTPMYMILNQAVGGNWPGSPDSTTDWSKANYQVDYVRAYQHGSTPTPTPTPTPPPASSGDVVISNKMTSSDLSDSYRAAATGANTTRTYTASQMAIAGVNSPTTVTVAYNADKDITLTNNGVWGGIRAATVKSNAVGDVTIRNFVDAQIALNDTARVITISGTKRGNITTGAGSDSITVAAQSDTNDINLMTINAGNGNNQVSFTGASNTRVSATTGSGTDTITVSGQTLGTVNAGSNNDRINTRTSGTSTVTGGTGRDVFSFVANAHATIRDYSSVDDRIELSGVRSSDVRVSNSGGSTFIDIGSSGRITVAGVTHTQAGLNLSYA